MGQHYWILAPKEASVRDIINVCYDFQASGQNQQITLRVYYHGWGDQTITLTPNLPCQQITVPVGCTGITIEDHTGGSGAAEIDIV